MFKLFVCAVCQVEIQPREGVSIYAGSSNRGKLRAWDGPFLCLSCQEKKEAMEGKRPSGGLWIPCLFVFWSMHVCLFKLVSFDPKLLKNYSYVPEQIDTAVEVTNLLFSYTSLWVR